MTAKHYYHLFLTVMVTVGCVTPVLMWLGCDQKPTMTNMFVATTTPEPLPAPPISIPMTVLSNTTGQITAIVGVKVTPINQILGKSLLILSILTLDPEAPDLSHIILNLKAKPLDVRYRTDVLASQRGWVDFTVNDGVEYCFDGSCSINQAVVHLHSLDELH